MAETRQVVLGKVAAFSSVAVRDDRRNSSGKVQHISDILPLVLAKYSIYETQHRYAPRGPDTGPRT